MGDTSAENLLFPPLISFSPIFVHLSKHQAPISSQQQPLEHINKEELETMASVSMAMPLTSASQNRLLQRPTSEAFFQPLQVKPSKKAVAVKPKSRGSRLEVKASLKEKAITGLTAAALTASMVLPEAAEAASGLSPSLKNFLLSIVAGGVVLGAIVGAVIGVANFDPVKRT